MDTSSNLVGLEPTEFDRTSRPQRPRSPRDPATKKALLLALEPGTARPRHDENYSMANALKAYTCPTGPSYDPVFAAVIREKHPDWFYPRNMAEILADLLALPTGAPQPKRPDPVGRIFRECTRRTGPLYDAKFDARIRKQQPDWFKTPADHKKEEMLALPVGTRRPTTRPLGTALTRYTCPKNPSYDADFDVAIRKKHPRWFREWE